MVNNEDQQLAASLRTVITRLIKKLRKESKSAQDLSLTERSVIALLDQHRQLLPSELAATEKITNQSMSQILNHLDELGYITRTASETDKRKVFISLSDEGLRMLLKVRSEREEWLIKAIKETCTPEEQVVLKTVVGLLTKILEFE